MTSLSLQPDAFYQFCISVAMRIAIQLLWFLLLVFMFWEVSCRCVKKLSYQETEVCCRGTCPGESVLGLLIKGKNPTAACFCVSLALFRYLHAHFSLLWKLTFGLWRRKKQVEKVVIMCILFEFSASFLELVPLRNPVFPFLWLAVRIWEHIITDW